MKRVADVPPVMAAIRAERFGRRTRRPRVPRPDLLAHNAHVLYVVRYEMKDSSTERVMATYPRHRAYLDEVAKDGEILLIGPLLPAPGNGALAVFRSREAAEGFPTGDPFVLEGLAGPLPIQEWDALEYV